MKGQVTVVTIVLISGILIALIGVAYAWGIPLINKGQANTIFQSATVFVKGLNDKAVGIANTGGEASFEISPPGLVRVLPFNETDPNDPNSNSIIYEVFVTQPLALNNSPTYIGGVTFKDIINQTGTFGEAPPSIISFRIEPMGTQWLAIYEIHFRVLKDTTNNKEYIIALNMETAQEVSGLDKISVRSGSTIIDPNSIPGIDRVLSGLEITVA